MPNASSHEKASPSRALDNGYDFGIGRRLHNLPRLREIGFAANRRLIEAECSSHDYILSEDFRA